MISLMLVISICAIFIIIGSEAARVNEINGEPDKNGREVKSDFVKAIAKRTLVSGKYSYTSYFITFEFEDKNRVEFLVSGEKYALIIEGDEGELSFQGEKFLKFDRKID